MLEWHFSSPACADNVMFVLPKFTFLSDVLVVHCCRNVGHETGSAQGEQSSSHQNQRKKLHRHELKGSERNKHGCTRNINMRTPCVNTTSAATTNARQVPKTHKNQHYQRVLTVVYSFPKHHLVLRFTCTAGVCTPPRPAVPPHTETRTSISM